MLLDFHSEIYSWIRGGLFVLFIYHFVIFFQNRSKLFLYYSLYLLTFTIFLSEPLIAIISQEYQKFATFSIQLLAYAAYIAFARELLDTRSYLIKWDKYFKLEIKVLILLAPVFILIQLFLGFEYQLKAFFIIALLITVFTLVTFYIIITRIRNQISNYFVITTLFYVVFANISLMQLFIGKEPFVAAGVLPEFFIYLGVIIQCVLLSVIIGAIIKKIEDKSKNAEIRLAVKLKEMEELKMRALQSQMNPHFLFNSLNSINNFILKSEINKASDYITKFSKLIRVILNSSLSPTTALADELEILGLYVKLEQMRIAGGFEYIVNVDENVQLENIKVPPLFLQPFVENSIWHGIIKKVGNKFIELSIKIDQNKVICIITDNGIGINKAKELEQISQKRKFFGAKATENRIQFLHKNKGVNIETKDISSGENTGTQVLISFPLLNVYENGL